MLGHLAAEKAEYPSTFVRCLDVLKVASPV